MHHRRPASFAALRALCPSTLALTAGLALTLGCSATSKPNDFLDGEGGAAPTTTKPGGGGAGPSSGAGGAGGTIDTIAPTTASGTGGSIVPIDPCDTSCGPAELCDDAHLGTDDNCNGVIDEGCSCSPGQARACFKGDPAKRDSPGCFDGTQRCNELGAWSDCIGGVHYTTAPEDAACFAGSADGCQAITAVPFADVSLKTGTGNFGTGATNETWTVECPPGVSPCPAVSGDVFKPLQSGEYSVTYTRTVGGTEESCTYPLIVGDRGLRVELAWEWPAGQTVDLDLHMLRPGNTTRWALSGAAQDCGYSNCKAGSFSIPLGNLTWFNDAATPPDPVNWFKDPDPNKNSCYFSPHGAGNTWKSINKGCHSPRLDLDNITCDQSLTNINSTNFCAPENINVDFPPTDAWTRVGVHYYRTYGVNYAVHPSVKIYCDGALAAELGPQGYNDRVTFGPNDSSSSGNPTTARFWPVADVYFPPPDTCGRRACVVQPLYADPALKTPYFMTKQSAEQGIGPAYPPIPATP